MKFKKALKEGRYHTTSGDFVPAKNLRDEDIARICDGILNKFSNGTIKIEFAQNPKDISQVTLIAKFGDDCVWLMGHGNAGPKRYKDVNEFIHDMEDSVYSINQHVDKPAVRENLFDPDQYKYVIQQIKEFADNYPKKSKSLSYNPNKTLPGESDTDWDMEIKFRRNRFLRGGHAAIYPSISGDANWGQIISPNEEERYDPSIFK